MNGNAQTLPEPLKLRLQTHFGVPRLPFRKAMGYDEMFDSRVQRELLQGLQMWADLHGMALVTGPSGAGKSITARRFARGLDESRFRVVYIRHARSTLNGFLRSLNRALDLPMRQHAADLFDQAHRHLTVASPDRGPHPLLVLDDAEAMRPEQFDVLRRLTNYALDAEDRFSILIAGTDSVLRTLKDPALEPFNTRLSFVASLKAFTLEDTRNYVRYQLLQAGASDSLFAEDAVRRLFNASKGIARRINQIALQAMMDAAVRGLDDIKGDAMQRVITAHPLYDSPGGP